MAANLVDCNLRATRAREVSSGATEIIVTYRAKFDDWLPAPLAIPLARDSSATAPLPNLRQAIDVTIGGRRFASSNFVAAEFEATPVGVVGGQFLWEIEVIFRSPNVQVAPDSFAIPPIERPFEVWTEQIVKSKPRNIGKNVSTGLSLNDWQAQADFQPAQAGSILWPFFETEDAEQGVTTRLPAVRPPQTEGPITNAAGHRYGPEETLETRLPVFVFKKNVTNPFVWVPQQTTFENKINDAPYDLFGLGFETVDAYSVMFWYMQTTGPFYYGDAELASSFAYYHLECRLIYDIVNLHRLIVPNEGDKHWVRLREADGSVVAPAFWALGQDNCAGIPCQPPIPLDHTGQRRTVAGQGQTTVTFEDLTPVDFGPLNTFLTNET